MIVAKSIGQLTWQVVKTEMPKIDETIMTIDEKIEYRRLQRIAKNFTNADRLRKELEAELIFINDMKDGKQEVFYLTENYFKKMYSIKEEYAKLLIKISETVDEIELAKLQKDKLLYESNKALTITNKREYFDYRYREEIRGEAYLSSWLHRMNEQLKRDREVLNK